jgi:HAD superfamily hydrolase (TIGR01509 family)
VSEAVPEAVSEAVSEAAPEAVSQAVPESVPEREIDLVLFDLGGVLIEPGGVGPMRELSGLDSDEALWARWLGCRWVQALESGKCTPEAFAAGLVEDWGLAVSAEEFLAQFVAWSQGPYPGAELLVEQVQTTVPVAFLSNMNRCQWEAHYEALALTQGFDFRFLSYELGLVKPDPAVFAVVRARLPVPAERILFLDDNAVNVEAGTAAGFVSRHVRGIDDVRVALAAAGVVPG